MLGFEKPSIKAWMQEWGSQYEERDLEDGFVPALMLKGASDPQKLASPEDDPVVMRARKQAEKIREKGVWSPLFYTQNGFGRPRNKMYVEQVKKGVVPDSFWVDGDESEPVDIGCVSWDSSDSGTSEVGARELSTMVGDLHGFETVKPLKLFSQIV